MAKRPAIWQKAEALSSGNAFQKTVFPLFRQPDFSAYKASGNGRAPAHVKRTNALPARPTAGCVCAARPEKPGQRRSFCAAMPGKDGTAGRGAKGGAHARQSIHGCVLPGARGLSELYEPVLPRPGAGFRTDRRGLCPRGGGVDSGTDALWGARRPGAQTRARTARAAADFGGAAAFANAFARHVRAFRAGGAVWFFLYGRAAHRRRAGP